MRQTILYTLILLSIVLTMSGCTVQKNPVSGNNRLMAYDWEQEIEIGRSVDKEIVAQYGLYDDEEVTTYVAELSEKILAESHMRREDTEPKFKETEFFFKVLDSPVVNAFALPGGYVYFTRGLMAHLNNEAQLSVVIGHEIGHVAARHASQRAFQQQLGQIAVIGGSVLGQELLGLPGGSIMDLSSQAAQLIFLSYGRDAERESDRLGVEYAARTGYEASEGAAFFTSLKRISEQSGQSIPTMLSTHPDPGEREQTIPKLAQNWEEKGYQQTEKNRERYLEILDGMIFGENPRNGFFRDNLFLHPDLAFQFPVPAGWQTINQPQQVVLVSPNEDAVAIFTIDSEASSPQQSVQNIIVEDGITINSQQASQTSSGLPGYSADVTITQEQGRLRAIIHAMEYEERIYRFINYTSAGQFETYGETLRSVPLGFSELTDPEILNIEPVRIQLVEADRTDQFKNLLPDPLPMDITPEDVAILNQVSMEDQIEQGTKIKLPVQ